MAKSLPKHNSSKLLNLIFDVAFGEVTDHHLPCAQHPYLAFISGGVVVGVGREWLFRVRQ